MEPVNPRGDLNSPLYFISYKPTITDEEKGYCFAGTDGWLLDKMIQDAKLCVPGFFTMQPLNSVELDKNLLTAPLLSNIEAKKPPFIITCDSRRTKGEKIYSDVLETLVPSTAGNLDKYAGSLLTSPLLSYPHYVIPIQSPQYIFENYAERDITVSIDLARVREELTYYESNAKLQPLPERKIITEPNYGELLGFLYDCRKAEWLSVDIETIRPTEALKKTDEWKRHPGYPYTISLATSPKLGISFSLWDYKVDELIRIWRELDYLLREVPQIGQNYFMFDIIFLEALGYRPCFKRCMDTLIRHHILWPELPHSLQFQTRQYTRQPYYKDEGKGWKPSQKKQLMHYNALDTTVTYEVYLAQEEEFNDRPWLRG